MQTTLDTKSQFIEMIGMVTQAEGMPRISGRIIGLLIFDGRAYSFGELASQLQVSRGSISTNARMLVERGVIERVARPGDRQDYYQICENPYDSILKGVSTRALKTAGEITRIAADLPAEQSQTRQRLSDYANFYRAVAEGVAIASQRAEGDADDAGA